MFTYLADFALGLFVGVYALASFSPAHLARKVYQACWFFAGGFVLIAGLQKMNDADVLSRDIPPSRILGLSTLEWTVIVGITTAFVAGKIIIRRWDNTEAAR